MRPDEFDNVMISHSCKGSLAMWGLMPRTAHGHTPHASLIPKLNALQIAVARALGIATPKAERLVKTAGGRAKAKANAKAKALASSSGRGRQREPVSTAAAASRGAVKAAEEEEDWADPPYEPSKYIQQRCALKDAFPPPPCPTIFKPPA